MGFWIHVAVSCGLFSLLALGLNLILRSGVYSIASAAFYMIGAYSTGIGTVRLGLSPIVSILAGTLISAVFGFACIAPAFRVRQDRLLVLTLGFAEALRLVFVNWTSLTNGSMGISGIPPLSIFRIKIYSDSLFFIFLVWMSVIFMLLISSILFHSPWGLRLDGSRENEIVSYVLGISPVTNRYLAHTAGAIVSSLAGSLYAHHIGFISPSPFSFVLSVYVLTAVVLGGIGSPQGAIFASIFIGFTQPVLQLIGISTFYATVIRQLIFGLVLIGIILWLPEGFYKKNSGYRRIGELSNGKY